MNGTFADGVYVNDDGAGGVYTRIADFSGTTNVYNNAVDMLAGNNLIA